VANGIYNIGRNTLLTLGADALDWDATSTGSAGSKRLGVVKTSGGYTVAVDTDRYQSILSTNVWGDSGDQTYNGATLMTSPTAALGVADAADTVMTAVANGSVACGAVVIWQQGASAAASPLWLYLDTATGLPITPNGADIGIVWDNGANKIFKL
jgi:hypothetical protein